jgi:geranylgeranyl diphosphate synthase, type I
MRDRAPIRRRSVGANETPAAIARLRQLIDAELQAVVEDRARELRDLHPELTDLGNELVRFVAGGGKRLRPALTCIGHELAGGDPTAVLGPALAVELVHTCALVHDDVIDRAPSRRGRPTAHVALAAQRGGRPDAERFGEAAAILLGDLAHVIADDLFLDTAVADDRLRDAFAVFSRMRTEVTVGQYLDVLAAGRDDVDPDLALTIAGYKSGRYSVARPLQIGAVLAGRAELGSKLAEIGVGLGQAFQLRDDVLGVFGSEDETGKSNLSDLAEGKRTYLVARTLERLGDRDRRRFLEVLGDPGLDGSAADELRAMMRTSGGLADTEERIGSLVRASLDDLQRLDLPGGGEELLRSVARYLTDRRG